ncbi:MAG: DUF1624 domain-containing protein [Thermoplasmatales archaeon]|nr:MAG: DUF1624 domain-containing protein [Thermoplasmatales archaeon]
MIFNKKNVLWLVKKDKHRFWEIDFLRGVAIIMMIVYHMIFDLNYFEIYKINLHSTTLLAFLYPIGTIFLLLVGISLHLSYSRDVKILTKKQLHFKFISRGIKIFILGLLITIATRIYLNDGFVVFGILHCIGLSIIFAYPFLNFRINTLIVGTAAIFTGIFLKIFTFDFNWLLWLGFTSSNFYTVDYFPIFPWFGVVLIGIFIGNTLYPKYQRKFDLRDFSSLKSIGFICHLGRYSLIIYFLHQPIMIAILYLFFLL